MTGSEIASECKLPEEELDYKIQPPTVVIELTSGIASLRLKDLWEYRELLYFMFWRDVKGRYRQMAFGPLWIIIAPIIQMVLYSVLFGSIFSLPSEGVAYPVFVYVALLPWQFFSSANRQSSGSLVNQQRILAKVYFPRLLIPISSIIAALIIHPAGPKVIEAAQLAGIDLQLLYENPTDLIQVYQANASCH